MAAEDGPFAVGINENERLIAGTARRCKEVGFDAGAFECSAMDLRGVIVAEFADVASAKFPELAGDHGTGDFSSGKNGGGFEFDFGTARGIFVERDESVGSVEANADDVDLWSRAHWKRVVRQRRRPQAARRIREMIESKIAGVQFAGISGTRAVVAK